MADEYNTTPPGLLEELARSMSLDVWGKTLLKGPAKSEMEIGALMLGAIFTYELITWSMLFWRVFNDGTDSLIMSMSFLAAVFCGALFAIVVWIFERSFFLADFTVNAKKKISGGVFRVVIIFATAILIAQPIELYLFSDQIEQRLYDETVRAEAVRLVKKLNEAEAASKIVLPGEVDKSMDGSLEIAGIDDTKDARHEAKEELEAARSALSAANDTVRAAQKSVARSSDESELAYANGALIRAQRSQQEAQKQVDVAQEVYSELLHDESTARDRAVTRRDATAGKLDAAQETAQGELKQMNDWIGTLLRGGPDDLPINPWDKKTLRLRESGFTDRVSVLLDILQARPPRWPPTTTAIRKQVEETFPGIAVADKETSERDKIVAESMRWTYWISHIVLLIIPLLSVFYKLLLPESLSTYFSMMAQAKAGNEDAREALFAAGVRWGDDLPKRHPVEYGSAAVHKERQLEYDLWVEERQNRPKT